MTSTEGGPCRFPLFREEFFKNCKWLQADGHQEQPEATEDRLAGPLSRGLKPLDLGSLPAHDSGPPTELQARRNKFAQFEGLCSEVAPGIFLGSDVVARSREQLQQAGITHVVNCVGQIYPDYFSNELTYLTLHLMDSPSEDITSVLYDVFTFIEEARSQGGRVLLHCSQGVSRSASLAIAHHMWRTGQSFDEAFAAVKAQRGIANPNIGFTCQLLNWHKKRSAGVAAARLHCVLPHSADHGHRLVLRPIAVQQTALLDPRGAFVLQTPHALYLWQVQQAAASAALFGLWGDALVTGAALGNYAAALGCKGSECAPSLVAAGRRGVEALQRFEGAAGPLQEVQEGQEPADFLQGLQQCLRDADRPSLALCSRCPWLGAQYQKHLDVLPWHHANPSIPDSAPPTLPAQTEVARQASSGPVHAQHEEEGPGSQCAPASARSCITESSLDGSTATMSTSAPPSSRGLSESLHNTRPHSARTTPPHSTRTTPPHSARALKTPREEAEEDADTSPNSRLRKIPRASGDSDCCLSEREMKHSGDEQHMDLQRHVHEDAGASNDDDINSDSEPPAPAVPARKPPSSMPVPMLALGSALKQGAAS